MNGGARDGLFEICRCVTGSSWSFLIQSDTYYYLTPLLNMV